MIRPEDRRRYPPVFPPPWASAIGDDPYGIFCEIEVGDEENPIVQRLRWIEPGSFMMGSPENEPGRFEREDAPHRVEIKNGFWLADTACTQALWQEVMSESASRSDDKLELPVRAVSWISVVQFLERLGSLLPQCMPEVPTGSEWEYACRASTTTSYWWGDEPSSERMNYGGSAKRGPVPVKSFEPNPWGLYQMHGNVWEWCADQAGDWATWIDEEKRGSDRVLRGGSWINDARYCRSAYRSAYLRGLRYDGLGFRFCLRSTSEPGSASAD